MKKNIKNYYIFGGWLKFYQFFNIFSIILNIIAILLMIDKIILELNYKMSLLFFIIDIIFCSFMNFRLLGMLKLKNFNIPNKIIMFNLYMLISAGIAILFSWIIDDLFLNNITFKGSYPAKYIGKNLFPFLIISAYLKTSKRVKNYYGSNANLSFL